MPSFSKRKTGQVEVTVTPIAPAAMAAGDEELMGRTQLERVVAEAVAKAMVAASAATSAGAAGPSKPAAVKGGVSSPQAVCAAPFERRRAPGHP